MDWVVSLVDEDKVDAKIRKEDNYEPFRDRKIELFEVWARYDVDNDGIEEDERSRLSLGFDAFLTPFLSLSAYYRSKDSVPQDVQGNADDFVVSLHTFF